MQTGTGGLLRGPAAFPLFFFNYMIWDGKWERHYFALTYCSRFLFLQCTKIDTTGTVDSQHVKDSDGSTSAREDSVWNNAK